MTVDREARDQVAVDLRRLATGRMINAEFDDRYYRCWKESQDLAVSEIAKFAWGLYGSDRSYRLKGRHAVSPEARRAAARAILFLHTNLEYQWPVQPEINLLWLLLPACYLLLWIAALWGGFVSRVSDVWVIVFVGLAAVPVVLIPCTKHCCNFRGVGLRNLDRRIQVLRRDLHGHSPYSSTAKRPAVFR